MIIKNLSVVDILSVLADEVNLKILFFLKLKDELCVCDLQNLLATNQSNISRHLKELKDTGLITVRQNGRWHYYSIESIPSFVDSIVELAAEEYNLRNIDVNTTKCD